MFDIIEEHGTYTSNDQIHHPHNGYYSGFAAGTKEV